MLRTALTIYLVLATLLSPAVCCCSLRAAASYKEPIPVVDNKSSSLPSGGCPRCRQHVPLPSPVKPVDPPAKSPSKPGCPCLHHAASPALLEVDPGLNWALATILTATASFATAIPPVPVSVAADLGLDRVSASLPFLSARDILRAYHILRC
jgi:hypothetical protein